MLFERKKEETIFHPKGAKNPLLQKLFVRFARDNLNDSAKSLEAKIAIEKVCPWLELKRQLCVNRSRIVMGRCGDCTVCWRLILTRVNLPNQVVSSRQRCV